MAKKRKHGRKLTREMGKRKSGYRYFVKPMMDRILSFSGLAVLLPLFAAVGAAVYLDDPGPVIFTQKRVGKDRRVFALHKFRTMKISAPHDVPTHKLQDPEQHITRVGRVLRKTSLDELPQMWDIFRGKMSLVGPRPALWNQEDLVAEREKYGANSILPGLTGLAQVRGRDELEIPEKAALDGEYAARLMRGGLTAFLQDVECLLETCVSVIKGKGVVEGGTGSCTGKDKKTRRSVRKVHTELGPVNPADVGFEDYGHKRKFCIDKTVSRRVLVTGSGSYIGESFKIYAGEHYPNLVIDTVEMRDGSWRELDFSSYDAVFHVAGIAHSDTGSTGREAAEKYYTVNTDLALETCRKAQKAGVKQFLFMSSMIIYGDAAAWGREKIIDEHTVPAPANIYGDSKWQADRGVRKMHSSSFQVAVLRPPMIYGKGSRGNYPVLAGLAKRLPVFPGVENRRSMLYIDSLCEFVSLLVMSGQGGVYFPQNGEYSSTCGLAESIARISGKKLRIVNALSPVMGMAACLPGKGGALVRKAFGNLVYSQKLSVYHGLDYRVADLEESIARTEGS